MRTLLTCASLALLGLIAGCATGRDAARLDADTWIAFNSNRSGDGDIYALHPASGTVRQLTDSPAPEGGVRYDAARKRVVYTRYLDPENRAVVRAAGGAHLLDDPNGDVAPVWDPTGQWIAYAAVRDGQEDVFIARPDGTEEQRLTNDEAIDRYPAWSPDGRRIAVARREATGWDLYLLDLDDVASAPTRLTKEGIYVGHLTWSPDGRRIAFDTLIDGDAEIAVTEVATGATTRLTRRAGNDLTPAWSPDGRQIAFSGDPEGAGNWDVWTVDVATGQLRQWTTAPGYDGGPVYVPASSIGP